VVDLAMNPSDPGPVAVPTGSAPHDVAPAPDGSVWYTAQAQGAVGRLDPRSGKIEKIPLGDGSAPHGVIVGPDLAAWVTDGGLNAIVRIDPKTLAVTRFPLPKDRPDANLNTAVFDKQGHLWFTGQNGIYGELDPKLARILVFDAPRGRGPYGICVTPDGNLYFASLAGSYLGRIDPASGALMAHGPAIRLPTRPIQPSSVAFHQTETGRAPPRFGAPIRRACRSELILVSD